MGSELPCKTLPFKTFAQKYSPNDVSIILFNGENIFTVTTPKNTQTDRLYTHPSTKKRDRDKTTAHTISVQLVTASVGESQVVDITPLVGGVV